VVVITTANVDMNAIELHARLVAQRAWSTHPLAQFLTGCRAEPATNPAQVPISTLNNTHQCISELVPVFPGCHRGRREATNHTHGSQLYKSLIERGSPLEAPAYSTCSRPAG
jgi:hypothetical protein